MEQEVREQQEKYEKRGYLNQNFRIFYLCDDEPLEFKSHYHEFDKIIYFIKGEVTYDIEGKTYGLCPGDIVLVGHHDIHKLMVKGKEYERMIFYIDPAFLQKNAGTDYNLKECFLRAKKEHIHVMRIKNLTKSRIYRTIEDLKHTVNTGVPHEIYAEELYQQVLFLEFMIHLNRIALGEKPAYVNTSVCNEKIVAILDYINLNLEESLSIDRIAGRFFISKYYMMRLFKEETGYSIGAYISNKRLLRAKEMIGQGVPITQACHACGFREYSSFSRAFKKMFGESPGRLK